MTSWRGRGYGSLCDSTIKPIINKRCRGFAPFDMIVAFSFIALVDGHKNLHGRKHSLRIELGLGNSAPNPLMAALVQVNAAGRSLSAIARLISEVLPRGRSRSVSDRVPQGVLTTERCGQAAT